MDVAENEISLERSHSSEDLGPPALMLVETPDRCELTVAQPRPIGSRSHARDLTVAEARGPRLGPPDDRRQPPGRERHGLMLS